MRSALAAERAGATLLNVFLIGMLAFLLVPIIFVIPLSLSAGEFFIYPMPGLSLRWYAEFFRNPAWIDSLWNSVVVAASTMVLAIILGTLAAIGLWQSRSRLGMAILVVLTVAATLQTYNPNLTRAALSLGASPVRAFFGVMLPLIAPGVATGALLAFATSFDECVLSLFLGSPEQRTLPRQLFSGSRESITPVVAVAATLIIVLASALLLASLLLKARAAKFRGESL